MRIVNPYNDPQALLYSNYHILYKRARKAGRQMPANRQHNTAAGIANLLRKLYLLINIPALLPGLPCAAIAAVMECIQRLAAKNPQLGSAAI